MCEDVDISILIRYYLIKIFNIFKWHQHMHYEWYW